MNNLLTHLVSFVLGGLVVRLLTKRPRKRKSLKRFKRPLFAKQNGKCAGCKRSYELKDFTIDHIKSLKKKGGDEFENLQLLCSNCNSLKGGGTMAELRAKLRARGII